MIGAMDKTFLRRVAALCIPMALQNLINTGVMAADVIMIGRVGEKVLSGASLAGQIYFILNLILFGVCSGASVLIAQYWGKRDLDTIEQVAGIALRITVSTALLFAAVTLMVPSLLMRIFTSDPEVIGYGTEYLRIIALTYPVVAFVSTYLMLIKNIERVVISTVTYLVSLCVNICMNALLIYGLYGFPALGIRGAALATSIARLTELAITLWYARFKNRDMKVRPRYLLHTPMPGLAGDFMKYSLPVIINEMFWGLAYSANAAIIGHLGSNAVAAQSVAMVTRQLATVVTFGISGATAIMIGKEIGAGDIRRAEQYGKNFVILSLLFGSAGALTILLARPFIIAGMGFSDETARLLHVFLFVMSYYCVMQSLNTTLIVGVFRAGGDTKFGLYMDTGTMWGVSIPLGCIAAFVLHLRPEIVYFILMGDEFLKTPLALARYRKKLWLKNVTRTA
ncbi:MAG: MATE family efflux transporter [Clostridium sp.]|nr:MATE family efflux transporter [Clostridium sp.]